MFYFNYDAIIFFINSTFDQLIDLEKLERLVRKKDLSNYEAVFVVLVFFTFLYGVIDIITRVFGIFFVLLAIAMDLGLLYFAFLSLELFLEHQDRMKPRDLQHRLEEIGLQ
jgi:hypothetical protein